MQKTSGLYTILSFSWAYRMVQWLLGASNCRRRLRDECLRVKPGDKVMDIGCGPADILALLPHVDYTGIDLSENYIQAARRRYGNAARFVCSSADDIAQKEPGTWDLVMVIALLHHLNDEQVRAVCRTALTSLRSGGRFVSFDNCFVDGQNSFARWVISRDRGRNVRRPEAYLSLVREFFPDAAVEVRHDLLNIPYTHAICVAQK